MNNVKRDVGSKVVAGMAAAWTALLCSLPAAVLAAPVDDYIDTSDVMDNLGTWLLGLVVSIAVTSIWYYLGARMFRCKPLYGNCLIAAIVLPVAAFFIWFVAGIFIGIITCFSGLLGILALLLFLIYFLSLYVKWLDNILELESRGVAILLVFLPVVFNVVVSSVLKDL